MMPIWSPSLRVSATYLRAKAANSSISLATEEFQALRILGMEKLPLDYWKRR